MSIEGDDPIPPPDPLPIFQGRGWGVSVGLKETEPGFCAIGHPKRYETADTRLGRAELCLKVIITLLGKDLLKYIPREDFTTIILKIAQEGLGEE